MLQRPRSQPVRVALRCARNVEQSLRSVERLCMPGEASRCLGPCGASRGSCSAPLRGALRRPGTGQHRCENCILHCLAPGTHHVLLTGHALQQHTEQSAESSQVMCVGPEVLPTQWQV